MKLDPKSMTDIETLRSALESWMAQASSDDGVILIAEDPPPDVVQILGGYLNVPVDFFGLHAAGGGARPTKDTREVKLP
jgi:hypothetical protein